MLEGAYAKGQESRDQVRRDVEYGKERGRADVERARAAAETRVEAGGEQPRPGSTALG
jgi:hypothetical protein